MVPHCNLRRQTLGEIKPKPLKALTRCLKMPGPIHFYLWLLHFRTVDIKKRRGNNILPDLLEPGFLGFGLDKKAFETGHTLYIYIYTIQPMPPQCCLSFLMRIKREGVQQKPCKTIACNPPTRMNVYWVWRQDSLYFLFKHHPPKRRLTVEWPKR